MPSALPHYRFLGQDVKTDSRMEQWLLCRRYLGPISKAKPLDPKGIRAAVWAPPYPRRW